MEEQSPPESICNWQLFQLKLTPQFCLKTKLLALTRITFYEEMMLTENEAGGENRTRFKIF